MQVPLTVGGFLERAALVAPDRIAVIDEPDGPDTWGALTYGELFKRARTMAGGLDAMGVAHGARVAIVSHNSARFLASFFGVSGFGRILVPINFRLNAEEISFIVGHSGATLVLFDPELETTMHDVDAPMKLALDGRSDEVLFCNPDAPTPLIVDISEDDTCSINYTSGTTARPKGVELTHRNCWLNAAVFGWHLGVSPRDVLLHTLPMFHANGWGMPYGATAMAATHIVLRKIDGEDILARVEQHGVTLLCCAPAVIAATLDAAAARSAAGVAIPGSGLVRIVVAGAPPPTSVIERVERDLGWEFVQIYGLTETSPLLTINRAQPEWDELDPPARAKRLGRAGLPAIGVEMAVDEEGEVLARANHVFRGYWNQPLETEKALAGGWFHTGDGGYLDGPYTVITDRKKDVIISGGENVSSIEVEDCLFEHPGVAEVAVIGVPDDKWGEAVKALVVLREGARVSESDLIDHCRQRLAHFKCPRSVDFKEALARTATGKLQKYKLRQPYWDGAEKGVH